MSFQFDLFLKILLKLYNIKPLLEPLFTRYVLFQNFSKTPISIHLSELVAICLKNRGGRIKTENSIFKVSMNFLIQN